MAKGERPTISRRKFLTRSGLGLAGLAMLPRPATAGSYPFQNRSLSPEERVNDLLGRMSVEEKIAQMESIRAFDQYQRVGDTVELSDAFKKLFAATPVGSLSSLCRADWYSGRKWENGLTPALTAKTSNRFQKHALEHSRWGIPLWICDATFHGFMSLGATVFPTTVGMGSTWNPELVERMGAVSAKEARAAGIHEGSVDVDIAREPRWSRVEQCFGEDPFLVSRLGVAFTKGHLKSHVGANVADWVGQGESEGGHNTGPCHLGPIELHNVQLKPFRDCIAAGARGIMSAYNDVDGIPCTADRDLLTGVLREKWGFKGYVISDAAAIPGLIGHRVAGDAAEACALAVKAGVDMDLWTGGFFLPGLKEAYRRGLVTVADIDRAVRRILLMKFESGLFDRPFVDENKPLEILGCPEHRNVALEAARQSLVLLSNPHRMLPLAKMRSLAVIGPNADTPANQLGDYTAPQRRQDVVTVLDGIKKLAAGREIRVSYAKGCKVRSPKRDGFAAALQAVKTCDAAVLVLGGSSAPDGETGFLENGAARIQAIQHDYEYEKDCGEGYDRASLRLGGRQLELLREIKALGKPLVVVLIMGRPLVINEVLDQADAVLLAWYPGMMGGQAVAEALFGDYNPGGKLPVSFPLDEGQLPVYYNARKSRPNYIDLPAAPRLSFGFGLSYTTFAYSDIRLSEPAAKLGPPVTVSVRVKNRGALAGDEVVQLYITDQVASIVRPDRELRGFRRIRLAAGETQTVTFPLSAEELGFYNKKLDYVVEPGRFTIAVGGSLDSLLSAEFELKA